jgi:hypothetical protein
MSTLIRSISLFGLVIGICLMASNRQFDSHAEEWTNYSDGPAYCSKFQCTSALFGDTTIKVDDGKAVRTLPLVPPNQCTFYDDATNVRSGCYQYDAPEKSTCYTNKSLECVGSYIIPNKLIIVPCSSLYPNCDPNK